MSSRIGFLVKIIVITLLLSTTYYLFVLLPKLELPNKLLRAEKVLGLHYTNLLQNRLAYVELTRLDPNSPSVSLEKSNLVGIIKKTNQEGLETLSKKEEVPDIDSKLTQKFPELLAAERETFERQKTILDELSKQKTYKDGLKVLQSKESIKLLTNQTNLILEYQFWLEKINKMQESLALP